MKRNLVLSAVLLFVALNALGQSRREARFANPLLDDVVQMSRAQLPEATILAFVRARQARLETDVTADDLIRLHRVGVSDRVVGYIASISGLENRPARRDREPGVEYDSSGSSDVAPADPGDGDVAIDPDPYGPVDGGWGWGWGGYPYWYGYSPFFYGGGVVVIRGGGRFHTAVPITAAADTTITAERIRTGAEATEAAAIMAAAATAAADMAADTAESS